MEKDIEYNFNILEYSCEDDILLSFKYDLSVYYKDSTSGYFYEQNTYNVNQKISHISGIQDIIELLFKIENTNDFTNLSFMKKSIDGLKIKTHRCANGFWSINNISKYE